MRDNTLHVVFNNTESKIPARQTFRGIKTEKAAKKVLAKLNNGNVKSAEWTGRTIVKDLNSKGEYVFFEAAPEVKLEPRAETRSRPWWTKDVQMMAAAK